jgi:hypothetical protein
MVAKERPAVAVIASPSSTHYEYVLKCVELGVHVFCEKPFVWEDVDDLGRKGQYGARLYNYIKEV